ncbi:MAG: 2,3-bisphosphoglycerate-independent phosphoglycerate mutase [Anaerolineales bacterium]|nr:2,3-bisphosphoglycerate-independent phosphoglycerate mutase [Anaerolineales bacterium]
MVDKLKLVNEMAVDNGAKIVLLLMDGLGGLALEPGGLTELEAAYTPNMNALTARASIGLSEIVSPGFSPGSGPGHLALFGYDPLEYVIGRGVLEALGIGFKLRPQDVAIRCNFCTVDAQGNISDRRAGRIPTEECVKRVEILRQIHIPGVEIFVEPVKEYRFALVLRGENLGANIPDNDPQQTGVPPLPLQALDAESERTVEILRQWWVEANKLLADHPPANSCTLRGISKDPGLTPFPEAYKMRSAAVAVYPMYKGVSRLLGIEVIEHDAETPAEEFEVVKQHWDQYDFFFVHIKKTDSYGEDGNFEGKVKVIESVDQALPILLDLKPDVLVITGDHSSPAKVKRHSWHPVPVLLAADTARFGPLTTFGETSCATGTLGKIQHVDIMPLALAHAMRLGKYGA